MDDVHCSKEEEDDARSAELDVGRVVTRAALIMLCSSGWFECGGILAMVVEVA